MSKQIIQYKPFDQYIKDDIHEYIFKGSIKNLDVIALSSLPKPTSARGIEEARQTVSLDILKPNDPLLVHIEKLTFCQKYIDDPSYTFSKTIEEKTQLQIDDISGKMDSRKIKLTFGALFSSFKCANNDYDYVFISVTSKPLTISKQALDQKYLDLTDSTSFIYHFIYNEPVKDNTASNEDVLNLVYRFIQKKLIIFNGNNNYCSLPMGNRPFYEEYDEYTIPDLDLFITADANDNNTDILGGNDAVTDNAVVDAQ